jgi:GNAT superfamily N-acetyltransferase
MSVRPLTIRPIEPPDREAWERLFVAYGEFYETAFNATVLDRVWAWLMDARHPVMGFVAVDDGDVRGFAHVREQPDTFTGGPGWFLDDLYVEPTLRGSGAGTALIDAVAAHAIAHGGGTLRWMTADDNDRAQRVYDRLATRTSWVTYEKECWRWNSERGGRLAASRPLE